MCIFEYMYVHVPHLEEDLQDSIYHAHAPAHESKERHDKLNKVITQGLKTMEPPRGVVQKVRDGVRNRLRLCEENKDKMECNGCSGCHWLHVDCSSSYIYTQLNRNYKLPTCVRFSALHTFVGLYSTAQNAVNSNKLVRKLCDNPSNLKYICKCISGTLCTVQQRNCLAHLGESATGLPENLTVTLASVFAGNA